MTVTLSRRTLLVLGAVLVLAVGVGIGALVGGGGGETTTVTTVVSEESDGEAAESPESETEAADSTVEEDGELPSCDEAGISAPPRKEGVCEDEGTKYVVVNEDSTLTLPDLNAELLGIRKTKTASSEYGETKSASGTYVIFTLEITNRTRVPTYFDTEQSQVFLYIAGNVYTEDFDVENYALDDSFLSQYKEIQPQGSQVGTVAFDIPNSILPKLETTGNLDIVNFSEEEAGLNAREIGTIRTYQ